MLERSPATVTRLLLPVVLPVLLAASASQAKGDVEDAIAGDIEQIDEDFVGDNLFELPLSLDPIAGGAVIADEQAPDEAARRQLIKMLKRRIAAIREDVDLSAALARKLELAGRGDIAHLFEGVAEYRRRRQRAAADAKLLAQCARLQNQIVSGPFDNESLFFKTLHTVLGEEQIERLELLASIRRAGGQIERPSGSSQVREIRMIARKIPDAGLLGFQRLRGLRALGLAFTRTTDEDLSHLAGMDKLEILDLKGTAITDAGMAALPALAGLTELNPILFGPRFAETAGDRRRAGSGR